MQIDVQGKPPKGKKGKPSPRIQIEYKFPSQIKFSL